MTEPLQALRSAVDTQIAGRIAAHKPGDGLNLLALGDSWCDYPLYGRMFGIHTDYPTQLAKISGATVLNLAHYGDASVTAFGMAVQQRVRDALNRFRFDAILVSMGGDDIAGDVLPLWLNDAATVDHDPARAINGDRLAAIFATIRAAYLDLLAVRDEYLPGIPVLAHDYDFPIPDGRGVCGIGPWLKPALEFCGWTDLTVNTQIIGTMLRGFSKEVIAALASQPENRLIHVQTQGLAKPADWANELHLTPDGFKQVALAHLNAMHRI